MKKFLTIAILASVIGCESNVKDDASTGSVVNKCPTGMGGSGGTATTRSSACVASTDCAVPAPCLSCPGETACRPYTASCIEGTCEINAPECPVASGGGGTGGTSVGGGSGSTGGHGGSGLPSGGSAPVGGGGGSATTSAGGHGGAP